MLLFFISNKNKGKKKKQPKDAQTSLKRYQEIGLVNFSAKRSHKGQLNLTGDDLFRPQWINGDGGGKAGACNPISQSEFELKLSFAQFNESLTVTGWLGKAVASLFKFQCVRQDMNAPSGYIQLVDSPNYLSQQGTTYVLACTRMNCVKPSWTRPKLLPGNTYFLMRSIVYGKVLEDKHSINKTDSTMFPATPRYWGKRGK